MRFPSSLFFISALIFSPASLLATETATGHLCAEDAGGVGECSANEINIANVTNVTIAGNPTQCMEGDALLITSVGDVGHDSGLNSAIDFPPTR